MTDNPCEEIKNQLSHPYIRERQAALKKIKALLDENQHVRECIELLQEGVRTSEYQIVADEARDMLEEWQRKNQAVKMPDDRQHIFGVVCAKCGHQNYYDKREICRQGPIFLGLGDERKDEHLLKCQECGESFVVDVDCEGY